MNTGHWLLEEENLGNEKSPHRCSLHWREQPAWAVIECVLHTPIIIYNKVEKEKLVACSIGNNQKIICTFISCSKILNCWLSVLFATNAVDLSSRLLI